MASNSSATAIALPNIAFIKYWGNLNDELRLPANSSLSMNLDSLQTKTSVTFDAKLKQDELDLNNKPGTEEQRQRVARFLDLVRNLAGFSTFARVASENNFPAGAGIASSSSAFAALAMAASKAANLDLAECDLSRLARRGSGSASRSVPAGFVEWQKGTSDENSFSVSIAAAGHWDLIDCIALVDEKEKEVGSSEGHRLAATSPLQTARLETADQRLAACRQAILKKDFEKLAEVVELDCHLMHAVMMTSKPPLFYWQPASLSVMQSVRSWRQQGLAACYTLDAGANVHVICQAAASETIAGKLSQVTGVKKVLSAHPGGAARLI